VKYRRRAKVFQPYHGKPVLLQQVKLLHLVDEAERIFEDMDRSSTKPSDAAQ
jgi:acyl-CoA synthetase (NDP forming)